jgi:hypothetical protein
MEIDNQILTTIDEIRAINHACTAGAVSDRLRMSKSYIVQRCEILRAAGQVGWTSMAGSLHRVTPIAVDATVDTLLPDGSRLIVSADPVLETGVTPTPTASSATPIGHDLADQIPTGVTVSSNDSHSSPESNVKKSNKRSIS